MIKVEQLQESVSDALVDDIFEAAEESYADIVDLRPYYDLEEVHRCAVCHQSARLMMEKLVKKGYPTVRQIATIDGGEHSFVVIYDQDLEIVADSTWQQFTSYKSGRYLPKVLIGTRKNVISQARKYGVSNFFTKYWEDSDTKTIKCVEDDTELPILIPVWKSSNNKRIWPAR